MGAGPGDRSAGGGGAVRRAGDRDRCEEIQRARRGRGAGGRARHPRRAHERRRHGARADARIFTSRKASSNRRSSPARKRRARSSRTTSTGASPPPRRRRTASSPSAAARRRASSIRRLVPDEDEALGAAGAAVRQRQIARRASRCGSRCRTATSACSASRWKARRASFYKKRADEEAIRVFADNLRELLLASPLGQKVMLGIDPGFRTGCKVVLPRSPGQAARTTT